MHNQYGRLANVHNSILLKQMLQTLRVRTANDILDNFRIESIVLPNRNIQHEHENEFLFELMLNVQVYNHGHVWALPPFNGTFTRN